MCRLVSPPSASVALVVHLAMVSSRNVNDATETLKSESSNSQTLNSTSANEATNNQGDEKGDTSCQLPSQVIAAIKCLFPSDDPLDEFDFDPTKYVNERFHSHQSFPALEEEIVKVTNKISEIDTQIMDSVICMDSSETEGVAALQDAHQLVSHLTARVKEMKEQAGKAEEMVNQITADIKQLDTAKKNLTAAIIMLNNLHILVDGVDRLDSLIQNRNYGQVAALLQSCVDVLAQLERHKEMDHLKKLDEQVHLVREKLAVQIVDDFHEIIERGGQKLNTQQNQLKLLAEACLVVDCLDVGVKNKLLEWIINSELSEYKVLFQENQDISWLDNIDKRFNWLKNQLMQFEGRLGRVFPPRWEVSERIAVEFCKHTASELTKVMANRQYEINVKNLMYAVSKTGAFELLLCKKYPGISAEVVNLSPTQRKKVENQITADGVLLNPFIGIISGAFEPHLGIYLESKGEKLAKLIDQFVEEIPTKKEASKTLDVTIHPAESFPSAEVLFTQYRNCLVECMQLSTGAALYTLTGKFQKNLRDYANKVLLGYLPKLGSSVSISTTLSNVGSTVTTVGGVRSTASAAAGLFQSFLKDDSNSLTKGEIVLVCSIILTAHYCQETTLQLEKKLREKIDPPFKEKINLSGEFDVLDTVISKSIHLLVSYIESVCESGFTAMVKTNWSASMTPVSASSYVASIASSLRSTFPLIRESLADCMKNFTLLCNRFAELFVNKLLAHLYKCKSLSRGASEQLLHDMQMLKRMLLDLPIHKTGDISSVPHSAPASYSKTIIKGMTRAEMILKVVMVSHEKVDDFIEYYLNLLPDSDRSEFLKVMDMKGVRKPESTALLEAFQARLKNRRDSQYK